MAANRAVRAGRFDHRQAVIHRTAGRPAAVGSKSDIASSPGQPAGLARGEGGQDYLFELRGQLAGVGVNLGLVFGRNRLAEDIRGHASEAWCTVGVRRSDSKSLACQTGAPFHPRGDFIDNRGGHAQIIDGHEHRRSLLVRADRQSLGPQTLCHAARRRTRAPGSRSAGSTPPA